MRSLDNPAVAVAIVGVMQLVALVFVFAWYAIKDRYGHDCDHGDHKLIPVGAQSRNDPAAPMFGKRSTVILYRCRYCSAVETAVVDGAWTLDQIRAWGAGIIPGPDWHPDLPGRSPQGDVSTTANPAGESSAEPAEAAS